MFVAEIIFLLQTLQDKMTEPLHHGRFHGIVDIDQYSSSLVVCDVILSRKVVNSAIVKACPIIICGVVITISHLSHFYVTGHSDHQCVFILIFSPTFRPGFPYCIPTDRKHRP